MAHRHAPTSKKEARTQRVNELEREREREIERERDASMHAALCPMKRTLNFVETVAASALIIGQNDADCRASSPMAIREHTCIVLL